MSVQSYVKENNIPQFIKSKLKNTASIPGELYRSLGLPDPRYADIRALQGRYAGERCFIVCTGPSLTKEDLLLLSDEYTFGMNSICKIIDSYDWVPTFYGIQDEKVFHSLGDSLKATDRVRYRFASHTICKKNDLRGWIQFPLNTYYHSYESQTFQRYNVRFSEDCYAVVYGGYSITYSLIQIAIYLGFKQIYIIGADNAYSRTGAQHFVETGHVSRDAYRYTSKFDAGYKAAKEYIEGRDISIVNVTRGGALELFPRANLEEVLNG